MKRRGSSPNDSEKSGFRKLSPNPKKSREEEEEEDEEWMTQLAGMRGGLIDQAKDSYKREKKKRGATKPFSRKKKKIVYDDEEDKFVEEDDDDDDEFDQGLRGWEDQHQEIEKELDLLDNWLDNVEQHIEDEMVAQGGPRTPFEFPAEWARPEALPIADGKNLIFQHLETTYSTEGKWGEKTPVIRLYGVTKSENSVLVEVDDFYPYLWCEPTHPLTQGEINDLEGALNKAIDKKLDSINKNRGRYKHFLARNDKRYIVSIVPEMKESIMDWKPGNPLVQFIKITVTLPQLVPKFRALLEEGELIGKNGRSNVYNPHIPGNYMCYESKFPYGLRFMVDKRLTACQWIKIRDLKNAYVRHSDCQYEMRSKSVNVMPIFLEQPDDDDPIWDDPKYEPIYADPEVKEKDTVFTYDETAPVRILSFDIECEGRRGYFPDPKMDKVIQICNYMRVQGETEVNDDGEVVPKQRFGVGFVLGTCDHIEGVTTYCFDDEKKLLRAYFDFLRFIDYDISTGYNIDNFDWKYIIERAIALGIEDELFFSRILKDKARVKKNTMTTKAYGTMEAYEAVIEGRIAIDMMRYIQREYKLRSYGLNAVSEHYLGDKKMDIHFTQIPILQNGTSADRCKLAKYCYKDALLPLKLWDHLMVGFGYCEMCRVTGVPMGILLSRGQTIKIMAMLTKEANMLGFLLPSFLTKAPGATYPGAVVLDPIAGFHENPIATLDFAALYPSIMIADNLGYSTRTTVEIAAKHLQPDDYIINPGTPGIAWVKAHIRKGVLPMIEERLLKRRKIAKGDMKAAKKRGDKARYTIFNARQLALKIVANSGYGFAGSMKLPCLDICRAVTGEGRAMLYLTKDTCESYFTVANGYEYDCKIIYGDTDSVMVDFGPVSKERNVQLGDEASKLCKKLFRSPHDLENEKTYFPYLLMKKKRYCGLMWVKPNAWTDLPFEEWKFHHRPNDIKKGIFDGYTKVDTKGVETVRRDNARIVGNTLQECIKCMIIESDPAKAVKVVHKVVDDLMTGKTQLWDLIISEGISKRFEEYEKSGVKRKAVELAKRWQKRDPTTAPKVGDRVPYVVCDYGGIKMTKTRVPQIKNISAGTEDPIYAMENDIPILVEYYLWNQLMKPLLKLFSPVVAPGEDIDVLINGKPGKETEDGVAISKRPWESGAFELLFASHLPHMKKRRKVVPKAAPLFKHMIVLPKCLGCKTPLRNAKKEVGLDGKMKVEPLCTGCQRKREEVYGEYRQLNNDARTTLEDAHRTCVTCLGPGEDIFLCSNKDCWNLYARKKAAIDMEDIAGKFDRFVTEDKIHKTSIKPKIKVFKRKRQK